MLTLNELCQALALPYPKHDGPVTGLSIDSRTCQPGEVFVAIEGPNFDGHDFVAQAFQRGACAAVVSKPIEAEGLCLTVADTTLALGQIGHAVRQQFSGPVIGITGSVGKTSTKEMMRAVLSTCGEVLAPKASFNNAFGVPLTLAQLTPSTQFAVIEMGMNHKGEIDYVSRLAQPDMVGIINVSAVHSEYVGTVDDIARAKAEIFQGLRPGGTVVLNADSAYFNFWCEMLSGPPFADRNLTRLSFATQQPADITAKVLQIDAQGCPHIEIQTPAGQVSVHLKVPGAHLVENVAMVAAFAHALNIPLAQLPIGLSAHGSVPGRLHYRPGLNQSQLIDDSYNASFVAVKAAIDLLKMRAGKRILVFGDMGELGEQAVAMHQAVGAYAVEAALDAVLTCGKDSIETAQAAGKYGQHFATQQQLIDYIKPQLDEHTSVLIKGSRSSHMEHVVNALLAEEKGS